jgi:hypothetical protein
MKSRTAKWNRPCMEALEIRSVPSGCQAFGADVSGSAHLLNSLGSNLGALISAAAQTGPGAVSSVIHQTQAIDC